MTQPDAPAAEAPVTPPAPAAQPAPVETDWKAESRKWEDRAKANKDAADRLTALEESQKTEAQKLSDRAAAAEQRAADLEAAAAKRDTDDAAAKLRAKVAEQHKIPADLAARLVGADEAELAADAKRIAALLKPAGAPDIDQGVQGGGGSAPIQLTQADLVKMSSAQIVQAQAEGRCNDLLRIK